MTYPLTHFPRYQSLGQGKRNEKTAEHPFGNSPILSRLDVDHTFSKHTFFKHGQFTVDYS